MDGRDRVVTYLPPELILCLKWYQECRRLPSLNAAVTELLECAIREWAALDNAVITP